MVFAFLGTTEIIIILVIALLVFGPQKLPEIGKQVGTAMRELNKVRNDVQKALELDDFTNPNSYDTYNHDAYDNSHNTANNALPHYESPQGVTHAASSDAHYPHFGVNDTPDGSSDDATHTNAQTYHNDHETSGGTSKIFAAPPGPKGLTLSAPTAAEGHSAPQETV